MTEKLTRLISKVASWVTGETHDFCHAVLCTQLVFTFKGYSQSNVMWLCKQIAHETAWGTSLSMKIDRNAWGMNCVSIRENKQAGCRETNSGEVLGVYPGVWDSCLCRHLWDDYWGIADSKKLTEYSAQVSERYHSSANYRDAVSSVDSQRISRVYWVNAALVPLELFIASQILKYGWKIFE